MQKIDNIIKSVGITLAIFALLLNPFFIGAIFRPAEGINNVIIIIIIVIFEFVLAFLGLFIFLKPKFFIGKKKEVFLFLASCLFSIIVLEVGARILWEDPVSGWYGYPNGICLPDATKGYKYNSNFEGFFPNPPYDNISIKINSKGLRDYEHEYIKPERVLRILGLGDSITFGSGVEYEDTYLRQLEKKMMAEGFNAEIIKAGVNSYEFDQEYTYYFEEGYKYDPDIVIVGIAQNDYREITPEIIKELYEFHKKLFQEKGYQEQSNYKLSDYIKKYCKFCKITGSIFRSLNEKKQRKSYNKEYFDKQIKKSFNDNWERYRAKILDMKEKLDKKNIVLVLVIFPNTEQFIHSYNLTKEPQNKITGLASATSIDLLPYLDLSNYKDYYLGGDSMHLNRKGYEIVADAIYSELLNKKIIQKNEEKQANNN